MDAEQLSALLAQIENLELTVRAAGPSPLASDAIAAFVAGIGSPGTATNYRYVLTMLARSWPALTHDGLTADDLRRILSALVAIVARIAGLEAENERLRADVTALLTGDMVGYGTEILTPVDVP